MPDSNADEDDAIIDQLTISSGCDVCQEVCFPCLPGEVVIKSSMTNGLAVVLTNLRLNVLSGGNFFNVPRPLIDYVELKDLVSVTIYCKDARSFGVEFESADLCAEWWKYFSDCVAAAVDLKSLFAFAHFKAKPSLYEMPSRMMAEGDPSAGDYCLEIKRLNFNTDTIWRTSEINTKFSVCASYPKLHIVPSWITDDELRIVAHFRSMRRFPSVVWRHSRNGAVLVRCSQPEVGLLGWRCKEDEKLLRSIAEAAALDGSPNACSMTTSIADGALVPRKFLVVDARSYPSAVANRAKGGGCEFQGYYDNCEIKFMGLTNIHGIRKSFQSLRTLVLLGQDQANWLSSLETTKWLHYISLLIRSSLSVVDALEEDGYSVLVHCSDGWDRTPQLVSMAKLLLDPFYRTIAGFEVLVQREWIDFGHKFSDRCGVGGSDDHNERCPVFLQWLDCVHQLTRQFPTAFEFNELYLVKLARHAYSGTFGTFLCNQPKERQTQLVASQTHSIWSWLMTNRQRFLNHLYCKTPKVLRPIYHVRCLFFWDSVYVPTMYSTQCNSANASMQSETDCSAIDCAVDKCDRHDSVSSEPDGVINGRLDNTPNGTTPIMSDLVGDNASGCSDQGDDRVDDGLTNGLSSSISTGSVHTLTEMTSTSCSVESTVTSTSPSRSPSKTTSPVCKAKFAGHRRSQSSGSRHALRTVRRSSLSEALDILQQHPSPATNVAAAADDTPVSCTLKIHELSRCLDTDGLIRTVDAVQERIQQIKVDHRVELGKLQRCLEIERAKRLAAIKDQYGSSWKAGDCYDDVLSLPGSSGGERASLSSISNEEGWEQVQFDDVQPTKWVPDHVASHCNHCDSQFNIVVRRHHCRKCGLVFCSSCSDQCLPVPDEQLYEPVRVCNNCYELSS